MATKYQTLKGTAEWAKVYEPDDFAGASNYKLNFYPFNDGEWDKYNKMELMLSVKDGEFGKFITFRRPTKKVIKDDLVVFSPPEISGSVKVKYVDEEGNKIRQYNKGDGTVVIRVDGEGNPITGKIDINENAGFLIGNGSVVLVNLSYYPTAKGNGHRLENITVLEHVEVVKDSSYEEKLVPKQIVVEVEEPKVKKEKIIKDPENTNTVLDDSDSLDHILGSSDIPW